MGIKIIRETLADKPHSLEVVCGYDDISMSMGNVFASMEAQEEANKRDDVKSVSHRSTKGETITHYFTLMGHNGESLVQFYAHPDPVEA